MTLAFEERKSIISQTNEILPLYIRDLWAPGAPKSTAVLRRLMSFMYSSLHGSTTIILFSCPAPSKELGSASSGKRRNDLEIGVVETSKQPNY